MANTQVMGENFQFVTMADDADQLLYFSFSVKTSDHQGKE
jgi:hypothetical protein